MNTYPPETLGPDDDDGTMPENVAALAAEVVGHRIVKVEHHVPLPDGHAKYWVDKKHAFAITLDNGKRVHLMDTGDCCAFTALDAFLLHVDRVDHIITGVGTTDGYTVWHIFADFGDVMELRVGWSCGNPFYYGYGFDIVVQDIDAP
jgi:hypothetical protein